MESQLKDLKDKQVQLKHSVSEVTGHSPTRVDGELIVVGDDDNEVYALEQLKKQGFAI